MKKKPARKVCGTPKTPPCPAKGRFIMGPARSPWSYGRGGRAAAKPSCTPANLFTECFRGCNNVPNCGWNIVIGTVVFTGENVTLDPGSGAAVIYKTFVGPQLNTTLQVRFREIDAPPLPTFFYGMGALDAAGLAINAVQLVGDGTLHVLAAGVQYSGVWTPQAGATHTVHFTVDGAGAPNLFIDGAQIALVLGGPPQIPAPFGNAMAFSVINFGGPPSSPAVLFDMFEATGVFPPGTSFCCPSGLPLA